MPIPFKGGCHCGAVRYVCSEEPTTVINCHCEDCRKIAGSAFITGVLVPPAQSAAPVKSAEVAQPSSSEMKIDDSDDDTLDYFSKLAEEE